jgi:hypothetical protein
MPVMQTEAVVAAAGINTNVFAGSAYEYARGRQLLSLGAVASATGGFLTIQSGSDVILEESPPFVLTTYPVVPDQMFYNDVMEAFDRLRVQFRNPSGGALTLRALAILTPVG